MSHKFLEPLLLVFVPAFVGSSSLRGYIVLALVLFSCFLLRVLVLVELGEFF